MSYTINYILTFQVFLSLNSVLSNYLEVTNGFYNNKHERSKVVNKGIWVRNADNPNPGTFPMSYLFTGNANDVENMMQDQVPAFPEGSAPNPSYATAFEERNKRSIDRNLAELLQSIPDEELRRFKKSKNSYDISDTSLVKSKMLSKLKPASVFNDYPYEIAILLENNKNALEEAKNYSTYVINEMIKNDQNLTVLPLEEIKNNSINADANNENNDNANNSVPKRRVNSFESELLHKIELLDCPNKTKQNNKMVDSDHSNRESKRWTSMETAKYNVEKNEQSKNNRAVSEKGLIKVLSMLTNTFKKIMKQHNDIKEIHAKLQIINENFMKNIEIVSDKFQDFESKYATLVSANKKITEIEERINAKEKEFMTKEKDLSKNLIEFEVQQKKFLTQQRQFYDIQKLMLAQNEKINSKQNAIAKMQGEISHRQNNFARILKKAKHMYIDGRPAPKAGTTKIMRVDEIKKPSVTKVFLSTTTKPVTVDPIKNVETPESIKINLFSIPTVPKLENQDHLLLNEKDEHTVDDLVYKFYFNNTFIDSLMRNYLPGFTTFGDNNDSVLDVKTKRDEVSKLTTILLPVKNASNEELAGKPVNRERRWISHHSRKKWHHKRRGKIANNNFDMDDEKPTKESRKAIESLLDNNAAKTSPNEGNNSKTGVKRDKSVAFIVMAREFCNGIGQNSTEQILSWCIEKALRRLQNIDIKMPPPPPPSEPTQELLESPTRISISARSITAKTTAAVENSSMGSSITTTVLNSERSSTITTTPKAYTPQSTPITKSKQDTLSMFFPDNEKLESNLRQYELVPDKDGNVYYDGSVHASEMLKGHDESESEFLPGLDSNSRIDTFDPETFRTQVVQRALINRMKYESIPKKQSKL